MFTQYLIKPDIQISKLIGIARTIDSNVHYLYTCLVLNVLETYTLRHPGPMQLFNRLEEDHLSNTKAFFLFMKLTVLTNGLLKIS